MINKIRLLFSHRNKQFRRYLTLNLPGGHRLKWNWFNNAYLKYTLRDKQICTSQAWSILSKCTNYHFKTVELWSPSTHSYSSSYLGKIQAQAMPKRPNYTSEIFWRKRSMICKIYYVRIFHPLWRNRWRRIRRCHGDICLFSRRLVFQDGGWSFCIFWHLLQQTRL